MEVTETHILRWHNLSDYVKGNKAYQYISPMGLRIYFDLSGKPRNVSDDSLVTDLEAFMSGGWKCRHTFNIQQVSMTNAINAYKNGCDGIIFETIDPETGQEKKHYYLNPKNNKPVNLSRSIFNIFTAKELLAGTWYIMTDTY